MEELLAAAEVHEQWVYKALTLFLLGGGLLVALVLGMRHRRNPPDKPSLTAALSARSWNTPQVGILLGSLFLLYFLATFSGQLFYEHQIPLAKLVITIVIYTILMAIIAVINRRHTASIGTGWREFKKLPLAPVFYLAMIPFLMAASEGWHLLLRHGFGMELELQAAARAMTKEFSGLQVAYMFTAIVVAPIYEELMFRGIIFPYLVKRTGLAGGTVLISAFFALLHFHLPSVVPLLLLSGALCLAYWRTGSLWVAIGMHAIFNAVSVLALNIVG